MTEEYSDRTCRVYLLADADPADLQELQLKAGPAITLDAVVRQAEVGKKKGLKSVPYRETPRLETYAYQSVLRKRDDENEKRIANSLITSLPGYESLRQEFTVTGVSMGYINLHAYSFHPTLKATQPRMLDAAWWFDPAPDNKPRYDWNDFLRVHHEAEALVEKHAWITEWKKAAPGRTADFQLLGITPITKEIPASYLPAWNHAGLKGKPFCEIYLRRSTGVATIYFGKDDPRALILSTGSPEAGAQKTTHWLDNVWGIFYHSTQQVPEYIVVEPDGSWTKNTRPK